MSFNNLPQNSFINQSNRLLVDYMADSQEEMVTNIDVSEFTLKKYSLQKELPFKWHRQIRYPYLPSFKVVIVSHRTWSYYLTNLIVTILLVLIVGLTTIFFPAHLTERCNIQLTVILAFVFFLSVLATVMPKTG